MIAASVELETLDLRVRAAHWASMSLDIGTSILSRRVQPYLYAQSVSKDSSTPKGLIAMESIGYFVLARFD